MGVTLTDKGVKPDPQKQDSTQAMPAPTNKEELRRLLGVVTYLSRFSEALSTKSAPLRTLLKNDVAFTWEANEQQAFDEIKALISSAPLLKYFNPDLPVKIQTDASSSGLGACFMQGDQPVQYASRALTETEKRYSQIEKEMLSVVFGLTRFHTYTYGRKVTVHNDHKPLAAVLKRPVGENPIRLQRMLCRIMGYDLDFKYIKGKDLLIADALSRAHTINHSHSQNEEEIETIGLVIQDQSVTRHLNEIAEETAKDKGTKRQRDKAHMGVVSTLQHACTSLWWPGMNSQLKQFKSTCQVCQSFQRNNPKESLISHSIPDRPWSKIAADPFEFKGEHYLVLADY